MLLLRRLKGVSFMGHLRNISSRDSRKKNKLLVISLLFIIFIYGLFDDGASISDCMEWQDNSQLAKSK
jgi:hypothetical protein